MSGLGERRMMMHSDAEPQKTRIEDLFGSAMGSRTVERLSFEALDGADWTAVSAARIEEQKACEGVASVQEQIALLSLQKGQAEAAVKLESARKEARAIAMEEMKGDFEDKMAEGRASASNLCGQFDMEKRRYFAAVESEVVKLALAIAKRVLQREVSMDPMLLRGVVRVALENVAEGSSTVLRVPVEEEEAWRLAMKSNGEAQVSITADGAMGRSECVLETEAGRMNLGVAAQLEEIERGFFDLLELRPE